MWTKFVAVGVIGWWMVGGALPRNSDATDSRTPSPVAAAARADDGMSLVAAWTGASSELPRIEPPPNSNENARPTPPAPPSKPQSPEEAIRDLEKRAPGSVPRRDPAPATIPGAAPPVEGGVPGNRERSFTPARLLREGAFLVSRRGRVVRSSGGEWTFVFDAGADGRTDAPMSIVPCQNLMGIERLAERMGEEATFTISGQVLVYHDRNYLLPTMYALNRRADVSPG
ncbi:MAG: hypothetical protein JNM07_04075 [Phycisphaerae bacterium]|nr:hypothetical protein [Phycisphaerae bacterium]